MPSIDFCKHIAETITSSHNQHSTLLIWAPTGKGKSWAGLSIGECVSQYVAEIKGGIPSDYFNEENIAVISQDEVLRVLSTKMDKKYSVIGFDDIGITWNSRDFMSQFNQNLNDIAQTVRTRNLFAYFTIPDPFLLDKVPRELIKYTMKVERSHFDLGYVECKIQEPVKNIQFGKKLTPFLLDFDGNRIVRHIVFRPSQKLIDNYDARRSAIERQNTDATIENMQLMVKNEAAIKEPRLSKKVLFSEPMKIDYNNGNGLSMHDLAKKYGVSSQTVHEALHYESKGSVAFQH